MPDSTVAFLLVPSLMVLTVILECTRVACIWAQRRRHRAAQARTAAPASQGLPQL